MAAFLGSAMDAATPFFGGLAGLLGSVAMLPVEIFAYRRWGLPGVFEWDEVHASLSGWQSHRRFGVAAFGVHLAFGGVAGGAFAFGVRVLSLPPSPSGVLFGLALWVATLALHEWPTAVRPWRNDMGTGPVVASLAGHLVYGAVLALLLSVR